MKDEKAKIGRPKEIEANGRMVNLDAFSEVEADRIGRGVRSKGIRLALKVTSTMTFQQIQEIIRKIKP
jgi:hypothetical protein